MTQLLAGRRILLIGIGFYDYEAAIADEFRALGAQVWVENERPPEMRGKLAPLRRRLWSDSSSWRRRHLKALLARARSLGPLDDVVVIKGEFLDKEFLDALRQAQPGARFVAYHWDSMARYPELIMRQSMFDRVLTFDHKDAATNPDFILRPLFFRPELQSASFTAPDVDLCFVGWLHHDRLRQIQTIRAQADALNLTVFFYFLTGLWTGMGLYVSGKARDIHLRPLPYTHYVDQVARAKVIVDLPHPMQAGLTMRAIESVGAAKKLITTAIAVTRYDLHRLENVSVVDAAMPVLDTGFLNAPAVELAPTLVNRYSLRAWALDVLGVTEPEGFVEPSRDS